MFVYNPPEENDLFGVLGLTIALAYEISKGDRSPWEGYLSTLPERVNLPVFWSDEELAQLEGTDLMDRVKMDKVWHLLPWHHLSN